MAFILLSLFLSFTIGDSQTNDSMNYVNVSIDDIFGVYHEPGVSFSMTEAEEENIRQIFDGLDTNHDGILSFDEFKLLDINEYTSIYNQMDLNEDNELKYNELVYYYKNFIESPLLFDSMDIDWVDLENEFKDITSDNNVPYTSQSLAEYLANILLSEIDTNFLNYITFDQFADYLAMKDWKDFSDNDDNLDEINFDIFKNKFYDSLEYQIQYNLNQESQTNLDELCSWYESMDSHHSDAGEILLSMDDTMIWHPHEFDGINESPSTSRRRLLFGVFASIKVVRTVTKVSRATSTAVSPPNLGSSCDNEVFKDWTGRNYIVSSYKACTKKIWGICIDYECKARYGVFNSAISSLRWRWSNNNCNKNFLVGSSGSDDFVCSNPFSEILKYATLTSVDLVFYDRLYLPACQIHDMCLKTNGNTKSGCNLHFGINTQRICDLRYPYSGVNTERSECYVISAAYFQATEVGAIHHGGINPNNCIQ